MVSVQRDLCPGESLSGGSLSGGWPLSRRGLCPEGDLCPGTVSVQGDLYPRCPHIGGSLSRGSLSRLSLYREVPVQQGISVQRGSLSRGISVRETPLPAYGYMRAVNILLEYILGFSGNGRKRINEARHEPRSHDHRDGLRETRDHRRHGNAWDGQDQTHDPGISQWLCATPRALPGYYLQTIDMTLPVLLDG